MFHFGGWFKYLFNAPVAQLDRVPGYEPGGREFESLRARQNSRKRGANCAPSCCRPARAWSRGSGQRELSGSRLTPEAELRTICRLRIGSVFVAFVQAGYGAVW